MATVKSKFEDIAEDLTYNVTKIYGREDIIIASDLVFHSVISFSFRGELVERGWTQAIIIGDTRTGKTETLTQLHRHYRVGAMITGEDVSYAGLIVGMQQVGTRWNITWGKLVLQNRREATLDEVNNLPPEVIAAMSGLRSSGIAEITKIQQATTEAMVRQIWLGNPRTNRYLNSYSYGIVALKELIGKLDDIARFDIGVACSADEVDCKMFNAKEHKKIKHRYTSDKCYKLIKWVWSRHPNQVKFVGDADLAVLQYATDLGKKYSEQIPLVNASEIRIKLARLSVAAAARLFSTDDTRSMVIVTPEHVEFVKDFLIQCYNKPAMGYDNFTELKYGENELENHEDVKEYILSHNKGFINGFMDNEYISANDIMIFTGMNRDDSNSVFSYMVSNKCLRKFKGSDYVKTPGFAKLGKELRQIESEKKRNKQGRM